MGALTGMGKWGLPRRSPRRRWGLALARVLLFVCLTAAVGQGLPYLMTAESYPGAKPVHPSFPVAVLKDGAPAVVRWRDYQGNPSRYQGQVLTPATPMRQVLGAHEALEVAPRPDGALDVKYSDEGYVFWSRYSVAHGEVTPTAFRFSGTFVAYWALLIAALGTALIPPGVLWAIRRRGQAGTDPSAPP